MSPALHTVSSQGVPYCRLLVAGACLVARASLVTFAAPSTAPFLPALSPTDCRPHGLPQVLPHPVLQHPGEGNPGRSRCHRRVWHPREVSCGSDARPSGSPMCRHLSQGAPPLSRAAMTSMVTSTLFHSGPHTLCAAQNMLPAAARSRACARPSLRSRARCGRFWRITASCTTGEGC